MTENRVTIHAIPSLPELFFEVSFLFISVEQLSPVEEVLLLVQAWEQELGQVKLWE